jgi:TolB-like protein
MASANAETNRPAPTIFLSYASEDRQSARLIGDALPAYGIEVWYDESELGGGDAWDQKIRRQIRDCDYFMALVSANTEARHEGYFRREWRLAVERTLDMADDHLFLLPVVIDDTNEASARVPEKFLTVQWLRVPGGRPTPALEALCRRLVAGGTLPSAPSKKSPAPAVRTAIPPAATTLPEFPTQEPGQRVKFGVAVLGWAARSSWALYKRLPRWVRWLLIMWLVVVLLERGCTSGGHHRQSSELSPEAAQKVNTIARQYQGNTNTADVAKLAAQFAREFSDDAKGTAHRSAVLALPFGAPAGDAAGAKLADSAFAQVYGRVAVSHHGHIGMASEPVTSCDLAAILERGREQHAEYVLCGAVGAQGAAQVLSIDILSMEDKSLLWSKAYPVAGADPAAIASEVDSKIPAVDDD